VVVVTE